MSVCEVVTHHTEQRLKGLGLPKGNGEFGDIIVKFDIKFPKRLNDEQKSTILSALSKST